MILQCKKVFTNQVNSFSGKTFQTHQIHDTDNLLQVKNSSLAFPEIELQNSQAMPLCEVRSVF